MHSDNNPTDKVIAKCKTFKKAIKAMDEEGVAAVQCILEIDPTVSFVDNLAEIIAAMDEEGLGGAAVEVLNDIMEGFFDSACGGLPAAELTKAAGHGVKMFLKHQDYKEAFYDVVDMM